jgi:hypothetical protein
MSSIIDIQDHQELVVDTILTQSNDVELSLLSSQFIVNEKNKNKYKKIYPSVQLNDNQLSLLYTKISNGIMDVSKSLPNNSASVEATKKMSANAQIKENEQDILSGDKPSIISLEGIVQFYTKPIANKIIKIIILRSLIKRYSESGDEYLVPFIFEFRNEILEFKSEWFEQIISVNTEQINATTTDPKGRVNHRKARMQKSTVNASIEQFDYPTVKELSVDELSDRIKSAVRT